MECFVLLQQNIQAKWYNQTMKKQNMKKTTSRQARFSERVYAIVAKIPKGKVMTYKQVAAKAGSPHAAREVGNLLKNIYTPKIPFNRGVRSDENRGDNTRGAASARWSRERGR